jgi:hypothetical protein
MENTGENMKALTKFMLPGLFSALLFPLAFAYKVEQPEQLPQTSPRSDIFAGEHAPNEATLISVGKQGQAEKAEVGQTIYLAQTFSMRPGYRLKSKVYSLMPGSMKIPFRFWINPGDLFFRNEDTKYIYFSPKEGNAGASFPGLGEVMSGNDAAGIRVHKMSGKIEWFVDNTEHNSTRFRTVWHRGVTSDELRLIDHVKEGLPNQVLGLKKIIYDGYFDNTLTLTLIQQWKGERTEKEYHFNLSSSGDGTVLLGGVAIQCLQINNMGLSYKLVSINEH